jgi:hypothetical protein
MRTSFSSDMPKSLWQEKTGFVNESDNTSTVPKPISDTVTPTNGALSREVPSEQTAVQAPPPLHQPIVNIRNSSEGVQPRSSSLIPTRLVPIPTNSGVTNSNYPLQNVIDATSEGAADPEPIEPSLPSNNQRFQQPIHRIIEAMSTLVEHLTTISLPENDSPELLSMSAIAPDAHIDHYRNHPLLAFGATNDPDTLYYHEAMKAPDWKEFLVSMEEEVNGQLENKVYTPVLRSSIPKDAIVLPAVWAMRRKRKASSGQIYRYKSRLNIGGHKQREGIDYEQTYSPVVSWTSIRFLLTMTLLNKWHTRQIDYVQAFPQAPIDRPMYMEIPAGFQINGPDSDKYVLEVHQNIYGQKQAGRVWNLYLVERLEEIGFKQSEHDPCVFYKGKAMYVLYTDDSILAGPDPKELDDIIQQMKDHGLKITSEGGIEDFLGITIERKSNGTFELTQKHLIDSILQDLGLNKENVTIKTIPAASSKILSKHPESEPFDNHFHYRSVIGKLNYLEKSTRPDIAYAVHQCARFSADPKYEHGQAVKWLGRYLYATKDKGMILKPTDDATLELYVDSDWSGNWDPSIAATDSSTARSRHGFILNFCGVPLFWASQLQTEIALSSTEAEYIGLSKALREVIPVMNILQEMKDQGYNIKVTNPKVLCRVFEDNSGALEMANTHKFRPRTKHLNIKYHHFRSYVDDKSISIHPIESPNNLADMLTKGQPLALLRIHRYQILGWDVDIEKGCYNTKIESSRHRAGVEGNGTGSIEESKVVVNSTVSENRSKDLDESNNISTLISEAMDDINHTSIETNNIHLNSPSLSNNYRHGYDMNLVVNTTNEATRSFTKTSESNIWLTVETATAKRNRKTNKK